MLAMAGSLYGTPKTSKVRTCEGTQSRCTAKGVIPRRSMTEDFILELLALYRPCRRHEACRWMPLSWSQRDWYCSVLQRGSLEKGSDDLTSFALNGSCNSPYLGRPPRIKPPVLRKPTEATGTIFRLGRYAARATRHWPTTGRSSPPVLRRSRTIYRLAHTATCPCCCRSRSLRATLRPNSTFPRCH